MKLVERVLSIIAPSYCIRCAQEGQVVCRGCAQKVFAGVMGGCVLCGGGADNTHVCKPCRASSSLCQVGVLAMYQDEAKELVHLLKFAHMREVAEVCAAASGPQLSDFTPAPLVVPLPTAFSRVRQRGYDQAVLLAKAIARQQGWRYSPLLRRVQSQRQVGATRQQRLAQARNAYQVNQTVLPFPRQPILLVDDVLTTGASMAAAACLLREAGWADICGLVVAWRPLADTVTTKKQR